MNALTNNMAARLELWPVSKLIAYEFNARTHSDAQVEKIAASIAEFGFNSPILVDERDNTIIAGHGRLMAAQRLGLREVPVIPLAHMSDAQRRAYILADNRLAEDAGWDEKLLAHELAAIASESELDLLLTGFDDDELASFVGDQLVSPSIMTEATEAKDNPYSMKVDAPHYQVAGEKPSIDDLYDDSKAMGIIEGIKNSSLPENEKQFLMAAASRHISFNFQSIAEYYAHSSKECQQLMEDNALVIVDYNKAIADGYVRLNERLSEIFDSEDRCDE